MTDVNALETLKEEHNVLSKRAQESKRDADLIRTQLQESQTILNETEEAFQLAQRTLEELEESQRKLSIRLEGARHHLAQCQNNLQEAHQQTVHFAQSLGPASQKQKRFEEALVLVEQNLQALNVNVPVQVTPQSSHSEPTPPQPPPFSSGSTRPHSNSTSSSSEANRPPRVDMQVELSFQLDVNYESAHNFYTGFTNNISEGGIFIVTQHLLDIGTQIKFPLSLPGMDVPEIVEGTVRWVRREDYITKKSPSGLGVQFNLISDSLRYRINAYIQQRESIFYDD